MEDLETTQPIPKPRILKVQGRIVHDGFLSSFRLPKVMPIVLELSIEPSLTFADLFGYDPRNHTGKHWRQACHRHAHARHR